MYVRPEQSSATLSTHAAAHLISHDRATLAAQTVAVYDMGGGTFDISILQLDEDGTFEVMRITPRAESLR